MEAPHVITIKTIDEQLFGVCVSVCVCINTNDGNNVLSQITIICQILIS